MLKALMKKQLLEFNSWLFQDKKKGKRRSKGAVIGYILLYVFVFLMVGGMFFSFGMVLSSPLNEMGLDWLYFALMGLTALLVGIFGSVFTATTLYKAKDNEMLLAMPIPPSYILITRLVSILMWSAIYVAIVLIPVFLAYWISCGITAMSVICAIALIVVLSIFVLALSCILGWIVAKISGKLKNKSFITVIISVVFFAAYYFVCFRISSLLHLLLANAVSTSEVMAKIFPVYWLGMAATGDLASLGLFTLMVGVVMALTAWVLNRSFVKMATGSQTVSRRKNAKIVIKSASQGSALMRKERKRFTSSANYMLNCALGTLMMPVAGIVVLVKSAALRSAIEQAGISQDIILLAVCAFVCMITSMNDITAPSISLEGKSLWILQSLPVSPWKVLKAKLGLHLWVTEIPAIFCAVCACIAFRFDILSSLVAIVLPALFVVMLGEFGLFVNLKSPNLTWTNEVVPIKQSMGVFLAMFGGWILVIALVCIYLVVGRFMGNMEYLLACAAFVLIISLVLARWLKTKGSRIFAQL